MVNILRTKLTCDYKFFAQKKHRKNTHKIYVICRLGGPYSEELWPRSWNWNAALGLRYGPTLSQQITYLFFSWSKLAYKSVCLHNFVIDLAYVPSTNHRKKSKGWFSLEHKHNAYAYVERVTSENFTRQISGFVLLMFLLMLMFMSRLFSLVLMLMLMLVLFIDML